MNQPEFYVITGPNGAGKSSFIRSRLNDFSDFEIIMTDVFKSRTGVVLKEAIRLKKNIVFETVFNDSSFNVVYLSNIYILLYTILYNFLGL
ncbi:MAG: hypothetical protein EAZ15_09080 [Sphingobacteriales bacterium]|nr:MAG: hypothetical protein EAZ15_09080 [Sphingobacteriales bacterium]